MSAPRVTVLMSVHNGGRYLRASIESVLAQTRRDFEFLILDDASTDDSAAQVESFSDLRMRLIRLPENIGLTRALNRGLREARGEFVARQDSDDLSAPQRLEKQIAFLDVHPEAPLIGSSARLIDAEGRSRGVRDLPHEPVAIRWLSLLDNPMIHTAVLARAAVIRDELGGYDESFPCCQDYDLWARTMIAHPVWNLRERLVSVREHASSISANRQAEARAMVRRVTRRLADAWLAALALDDAEIALLAAFRGHLWPEQVEPFHDLLRDVDAGFARTFSEAEGDASVARARASAFARIGYNLIARDRAMALGELLRAVRASPAQARKFPWLRMAALFVLGDAARKLAGSRCGWVAAIRNVRARR